MRLVALSTLSFVFLISGCLGHKKTISEFKGPTMGTSYSVKVASESDFDKEHYKSEITKILKKVNQQMSTYIKDSEISLLNSIKESDVPFKLSDWFYEVLKFSLKVAKKTNGSYDPTVGPFVNLWGFGPSSKKKVPTDKEILELKKSVGFNKLKLYESDGRRFVAKKDPDLYVDLSSSAKGFAVDKIAEFLESEDFNDYFVEVGGEIRAKGKKFEKEWMVAVERPEANQRSVYKSFPLNDMSIATSGSYRNYFESGGKSYSHTIDASTGKPVEHVMVSVTVLDKNCMKADAYATALMVLGPERAEVFSEKEALAVYFIYKKDSEFVTHSSSAFKSISGVID